MAEPAVHTMVSVAGPSRPATETSNTFQLWNTRADLAQQSLDVRYGAPWPQYLNNWSASFPGCNDTFNYWWLAHVIDVRLDAYQRTGDPAWLAQVERARCNLLERNQGSLFNDYFDDMLWLGLALERLGRLTGDTQATNDAISLWHHCQTDGWNETVGWSMAWRQPQLDYKNTPANGPFAILGARLHQVTGAQVFLDYATQAFDWITETLRDQDGFVEDGINRLGDGKIDTQWRFTYNQGLYIGAGAALAAATGQTTYLDQVGPTVHAALSRLTDGPVFAVEGDGGDEGLFKGIFYRYAATYLQARPDLALAGFIGASTQTLWLHGLSDGGVFEPGTDWCQPPAGPTPYSAHLSAIMATEAMAALMS